MTLEVWSTVASIGTFIVIAATAIAAVVQLRHIRSANKIAWIQTFMSEYEGADLRAAFQFVRKELAKRLEDPAFRRGLRSGGIDRETHPEITICNFFDQWGLYYRDGVIDRESFMRVTARIIDSFWRSLEPVVVLTSTPAIGNTAFEQFEYLTIQARRWIDAHPQGDFPKNERRIPLVDRWREEDDKAIATASQNDSYARE